MANRESDLKIALISKEEAENKLAKLEKMRSRKYLNDDIHDSLKGEYFVIKDRSDSLITNLEELNSRQLLIRDQYETLKEEYTLINKIAKNLMENRTEAHISEEQYNDMKNEYTKTQSDAFLVIAGIKADLQKSLDTAQNELKTYNNEFEKIKVKSNIGEIKQDEYIRLQRQYQNKIENSKKSISKLKKQIEAESPKDLDIVVRESVSSNPVSSSLSSTTFRDKIPPFGSSSFSGLFEGLKDLFDRGVARFWSLSPVLKIIVGFLVAYIFMGILGGGLAFIVMAIAAQILGPVLGILIGYLIGVIFGLTLFITGNLMIFYGARDIWHERKNP